MKKNFWRSLIPQKFREGFQTDTQKAANERYDLSRFDEQDIILENETQIQEFLPDILGQALARTWIDRRFLEAFYEQPIEILERAGVFLPKSISIEFSKEEKERPKVVVFKNSGKSKTRLLQLKLVMVAGT
jgi:hypothetical protein